MAQNHSARLLRVGISQGWYQSYLPHKNEYLGHYILCFKLYIIIKIYLKRWKMELLSFSLRTDNTGILILYLNTQSRRSEKITLKKLKKLHAESFHIKKFAWSYIGISATRWGQISHLKPLTKYNNITNLLSQFYLKRLDLTNFKTNYSFTKYGQKIVTLRTLTYDYYRQKKLPNFLFVLKKQQKWFHWYHNKFYYKYYKNNKLDVTKLNTNVSLFIKKAVNSIYQNNVILNLKNFITTKRCNRRNKFKKHFKVPLKFLQNWGNSLNFISKSKIIRRLVLRNRTITHTVLVRVTKQKKLNFPLYIKHSQTKIKIKCRNFLKKKAIKESIAFNAQHNKSVNLVKKIFGLKNKNEIKEFKQKQKNKHWRKIIWKFRGYKIFKTKYLKFYRFEQILSAFFKRMFGYIFIVKFTQSLHKIISTKFAIYRLSYNNFNLLYRYRKLRYFKRNVRLSLNVSRHSEIFKITYILKTILWYWRRKHTYSIQGIKELLRATRPQHVKAYKFVVKGKINARPRARIYSVTSFGIPWNQFNSKVNCSRTHVDAKTGTFTLRLYTYSGIYRRRVS